jgi:hypothetical protein
LDAARWPVGCAAIKMTQRARRRRIFEEDLNMAQTDGLLVHNVYFLLNDRSSSAKEALLAACRKHLPNHSGIVFFACGVLAEELKREVNDRNFDVALHVIFKDQAAHAQYQVSEAHQRFITENRANWKQVRVFDSVAGQTTTP